MGARPYDAERCGTCFEGARKEAFIKTAPGGHMIIALPSSINPPAIVRGPSPEASAPTVRLLACTGKTVHEPSSFVISCADYNSELTKTRWTSWNGTNAVGTTTFGLNLCNPYCAASRISFFPDSKVVLSDPVTTRHGRLYSKLVVTYKLHGKSDTFAFSWKGDPSF
jgi:hypothetical protein